MPALLLTLDTVLLIITGANAAVFLLMWLDKKAAQAGGWRCPERVLLGLAALGGAPALLLAMHRFRHKTRKEPFRSIAYALPVVHAAGLIYYF